MDKRTQVAMQCAAVRHLAAVLADINGDYARLTAAGLNDRILDIVGRRTANLMETLGDILNGMDATDEADAWLRPIFEEAHRLWPQKGCSHCGEIPLPESAV
jgi:hypothetical protein